MLIFIILYFSILLCNIFNGYCNTEIPLWSSIKCLCVCVSGQRKCRPKGWVWLLWITAWLYHSMLSCDLPCALLAGGGHFGLSCLLSGSCPTRISQVCYWYLVFHVSRNLMCFSLWGLTTQSWLCTSLWIQGRLFSCSEGIAWSMWLLHQLYSMRSSHNYRNTNMYASVNL